MFRKWVSILLIGLLVGGILFLMGCDDDDDESLEPVQQASALLTSDFASLTDDGSYVKFGCSSVSIATGSYKSDSLIISLSALPSLEAPVDENVVRNEYVGLFRPYLGSGDVMVYHLIAEDMTYFDKAGRWEQIDAGDHDFILDSPVFQFASYTEYDSSGTIHQQFMPILLESSIPTPILSHFQDLLKDEDEMGFRGAIPNMMSFVDEAVLTANETAQETNLSNIQYGALDVQLFLMEVMSADSTVVGLLNQIMLSSLANQHMQVVGSEALTKANTVLVSATQALEIIDSISETDSLEYAQSLASQLKNMTEAIHSDGLDMLRNVQDMARYPIGDAPIPQGKLRIDNEDFNLTITNLHPQGLVGRVESEFGYAYEARLMRGDEYVVIGQFGHYPGQTSLIVWSYEHSSFPSEEYNRVDVVLVWYEVGIDPQTGRDMFIYETNPLTTVMSGNIDF